MAGPLYYDRVMETSTTTGTGTYTLAGAVTGFQTFAVVGNTNTCYYAVWEVDANGNPSGAWEVNSGTYTSSGTTLSRGTLLASSTGSAISWAAGTRRLALSIPASFFPVNLGTSAVTGVIPALINAQTGTSYTIVAGDQGKLVTMSNGSAVAVTLPQATGSFTTGWSVTISNIGAGAVTITPTTSTIDGQSSIGLRQYQSITLVSDGTNYSSTRGIGCTSEAMCRVYRTTDQSVTAGATAYIGFDAERYDRGAMHDNSTNNSRITIGVTGIYTITATIYLTGNTTTAVYAGIWVNRTDQIAFCETQITTATVIDGGLSFATEYQLTAGDYIEIGIYSTAQTITIKNDRKSSPEFTARLISM